MTKLTRDVEQILDTAFIMDEKYLIQHEKLRSIRFKIHIKHVAY